MCVSYYCWCSSMACFINATENVYWRILMGLVISYWLSLSNSEYDQPSHLRAYDGVFFSQFNTALVFFLLILFFVCVCGKYWKTQTSKHLLTLDLCQKSLLTSPQLLLTGELQPQMAKRQIWPEQRVLLAKRDLAIT